MTKSNEALNEKSKISKKERERINKIMEILGEEYGGIGPALHFNSLYQLLIAVMLSAQTNDNQVNKITDELYKDYGTPEQMATLSLAELEDKIKTCGLYKNKAKNVLAATKILLEKYNGEVPETREELMSLPGVGRKTANVVLSVGFKKPALAVDTHVFRVTNRLGLAHADNVEETERQVCAVLPENIWADAHHLFIWHGRKVCDSRKPKCDICRVKDYCTYYSQINK